VPQNKSAAQGVSVDTDMKAYWSELPILYGREPQEDGTSATLQSSFAIYAKRPL
jgi:hypothetical protein